MNIEEQLKSIKKDYLKIDPPLMFLVKGWEDLQAKIICEPADQKPHSHPLFNIWGRSLVFAFTALIFIVFGLVGLYKVVEAAKPSDKLYPLKRISEDIVSNARGDQQIKVEHRAQEIVDLVKDREVNKESLKQVIQEYKQEVLEVNKELESSAKKIEFEKKVEEHQEEFKKIINEDSSLEKELGEVTDKEEIKKEEHKENNQENQEE